MTPADHDCGWRTTAYELATELATVKGELEALKRQVFGQKSEKMTPVAVELRQQAEHNRVADVEKAKAKRIENAATRGKLEKKTIVHCVPEEQRRCEKCGATELVQLGEGRKTIVYEHVPARFVRHEHIQETLACRCGETVIIADGAPKVVEKGRYGASFLAHLATAKCADSIPLYRLEKEYKRNDVPIARSTMNELFHRAAELTKPLSDALLTEIANDTLVHADETTLRVQDQKKCRTAYLWTFRTEKLIGYRFSPSRSGDTPNEVLAGTKGTMVVDGYTGYNRVAKVSGRVRAGCHAHVRRKFFDAQRTAPEAREALDLILELYRVEWNAAAMQILGTPEHLELRRELSAPIRERLHAWLLAQQPLHLPKSPIGVAINYVLENWTALGRFLDDARTPLDNNRAEAALRVAALGRKNFLFVGSDAAGENIAGLYSLVATCEASGVNPTEYLTDVLLRIQDHPASRIAELLPHRWRALIAAERARAGPAVIPSPPPT